jgi:hypothetical protein
MLLFSAASSVTKDVLEATKGVDVDARKEALQIAVGFYAYFLFRWEYSVKI